MSLAEILWKLSFHGFRKILVLSRFSEKSLVLSRSFHGFRKKILVLSRFHDRERTLKRPEFFSENSERTVKGPEFFQRTVKGPEFFQRTVKGPELFETVNDHFYKISATVLFFIHSILKKRMQCENFLSWFVWITGCTEMTVVQEKRNNSHSFESFPFKFHTHIEYWLMNNISKFHLKWPHLAFTMAFNLCQKSPAVART